MSEKCEYLHKLLDGLPLTKYPFDLNTLPLNGIYFFYEIGENWGHPNTNFRIVRIGTHRGDNFRDRISQHYLFKERDMVFDINDRKPSDRSIFRKNIGRVLLNNSKDDYLSTWNKDFTGRKNRQLFGHLRDIGLEKEIEFEVTKIMRENFYFRFVNIPEEEKRIGTSGLEKSLIGTVSHCQFCKPSLSWLGNKSPNEKIRLSGLWQVHHLSHRSVSSDELNTLANAIGMTKLPNEKGKQVFSTLESLEHKEDVNISDWTTVWSELRKNLQDQPPCPEHPEYPCVCTLAQGVINDVIHVGEDGIIVRSHRKLNERFITEKIFRTWWQYLEQYGQTSLKPGAENNPRFPHSCIVGAIMGTCLPNRIKIENNNLLEIVNH